ncbi:MAG: DUF389 domain-containing protein [Candidatus Obscuribacterales bacterium]|nr:DUF389 domain-containing protein [Candidatus Obscuribacterales bacterium]
MSALDLNFLVFLAGSAFIATLGLLQNSPAVIIGAMIIAPLMRPLTGLSLAILTADMRLLVRALFTLLIGTLIGIAISLTLGLLFQSLELTPEIISRVHPTLLDLGVAMTAGAIGAYCQSDENLSDTLAGVAIAVALVPPLSVIGIGIAHNSSSVAAGAALLYATNLVGITIAGALVFLLKGYIPLKQAKRGLLISSAFSLLLVIPLALSMRELILENQISSKIKSVLKEKTFTFRDLQLQEVQVKRFQRPTRVIATVLAPEQPINNNQVALVQDFLAREMGIPIEFKLRIIPSIEINAKNTDQNLPKSDY